MSKLTTDPIDIKITTDAKVIKPKRAYRLIAWFAIIIALGALALSAITLRHTLRLQNRIENVYQSFKDTTNQSRQTEIAATANSPAKTWENSPQQLAFFCYQAILQTKMILTVNQDPKTAVMILNQTYGLLENAPEQFAELKKSIQSDIKSLENAKPVDNNQIYSQIENLIQQINANSMADHSPIQQIPNTTKITPIITNNYLSHIREAGITFAKNIRNLVVVHQNPAQTSAILLPEYQNQVKSSINLLLNQAQIAVITRNQTLYTLILQKVDALIKQNYALNPALANNISEKIKNLLKINLNDALPNLDHSLQQASALLNSTATIKKGSAT